MANTLWKGGSVWAEQTKCGELVVIPTLAMQRRSQDDAVWDSTEPQGFKLLQSGGEGRPSAEIRAEKPTTLALQPILRDTFQILPGGFDEDHLFQLIRGQV